MFELDDALAQGIQLNPVKSIPKATLISQNKTIQSGKVSKHWLDSSCRELKEEYILTYGVHAKPILKCHQMTAVVVNAIVLPIFFDEFDYS